MATKTAGTNATTSIAKALRYLPGGGLGDGSGMASADVAAINLAIKNDAGNTYPLWPGGFDSNGLLFIPNRGVLQLQPGDWVLVDAQGWPILLSGDVMPPTLVISGTTNSTTSVVVASSARTAGWMVGMPIKDASGDIPASTTISAISADGLTVTISAAATGSHGSNNITAGIWTHS